MGCEFFLQTTAGRAAGQVTAGAGRAAGQVTVGGAGCGPSYCGVGRAAG